MSHVSFIYLFMIWYACFSPFVWLWNWVDYICRFVGVGEASFISLAAPFIDDNAPHKQVSVFSFCFELLMKSYAPSLTNLINRFLQRAAWLGLFYMCIPSGVALGYVYGGYVCTLWCHTILASNTLSLTSSCCFFRSENILVGAMRSGEKLFWWLHLLFLVSWWNRCS